jgi:hypothetical protein
MPRGTYCWHCMTLLALWARTGSIAQGGAVDALLPSAGLPIAKAEFVCVMLCGVPLSGLCSRSSTWRSLPA